MKSRVAKSFANITSSFFNKILTIVVKFVVRTVFIYTLGKEYLGLNGIFSSIISLLSLADLGFGIALPFSLYKPLVENDKKKIHSIMSFYSKVYMVVGISVLVIGVSLVPFLPFIIKEMPDIPHIRLIYLLYVVNSAVTYFFIYKKSLIVADQKGYIVAFIESLFSLVLGIVQIVFLFVFRNYIFYLILGIIASILQNIFISYKCTKQYPYIKGKSELKLDKSEIKSLSKNVVALFIYKVAMVVETSIDNVIISIFIGITSVGLYSNYLLIIDSLKSMLMIIFNSLMPSVGNVVASEKTEKSYLLYKSINLLSIILYGISAIAIFVLINPFIKLWVGETYVLDFSAVLALSINFYIFGSQNTNSSFRNAYGLFWEGRFRPVMMSISNVLFSVILVKPFGLTGVFIGTIISRIISVGIFDPYIIHKHAFKLPVRFYYYTKIKHGVIVLITGIIAQRLSSLIVVNSIFMWVIDALIVCIVSGTLLLIVFWRTDEFKYVKTIVEGLVKRIIRVH